MQDVDLEIEGPRLVLDFSKTGLDTDSLEDRVRELLPLLVNLLSADDVWSDLSENERHVRHWAYAAQNMVCQAGLLATVRQSELLIAVTNGTESIADHGFPELQDDEEASD